MPDACKRIKVSHPFHCYEWTSSFLDKPIPPLDLLWNYGKNQYKFINLASIMVTMSAFIFAKSRPAISSCIVLELDLKKKDFDMDCNGK